MSLVVRHENTTALTLHALVERHDGLFYDTSDSTFKAWASITGTNARVALTEDSNISGRYSATISSTPVAQWSNGIYEVIIRNGTPTLQGEDRVYFRSGDETDILFDI